MFVRLRRAKLAKEESEREAAEEARRAAGRASIEKRLAALKRLRALASAAAADAPNWEARGEELDTMDNTLDCSMQENEKLLKSAEDAVADLAGSLAEQEGREASRDATTRLSLKSTHAQKLVSEAMAETKSLVADAAACEREALDFAAGLERLLGWSDAKSEEAAELESYEPEHAATWKPLAVTAATALKTSRATRATLASYSEGATGRLRVLQSAFGKARKAVDAMKAAQAEALPSPPGSHDVSRAPLSAAQEQEVDTALGSGDPTEELSILNNVPVTRRDMRTLCPTAWLNDEVVNLFVELLKARANGTLASSAGTLPSSAPKCYIAQSNFYTKLAECPGYDYKSVRRWTKREKVDVFAMDLCIFPVNIKKTHWTLAVINFKEKRFEYYDPMYGHEGQRLRNLRRWLEDEHKDKKDGATFDTSAWTDRAWGRSDIPAQHNGHDCGVFMTRTADYLSRDGKLNFSQDDMPYFRRRMVYEILHRTLLP